MSAAGDYPPTFPHLRFFLGHDAKQGQRFDHLDAELAKVAAAVTLVVAAVEHLLELEAGQ